MKHYQLISPVGIQIAKEPTHVELENVDLFFKT
jgi:hypothetical protein